MRPLQVVDLGSASYRETWARQLAEVEARKPADREHLDDLLLLVEHPHVFTVGRSRQALANIVAPGEVEVVEIERGGDATYHGPGQVVAYPILRLGEGERDLHRFLRNLEEATIRTLAAFGLAGRREPGKTGVWLDGKDGRPRKICSMGIACRRWVTFHGLALNVATDLAYFRRINPCGFEASVMTTMEEQLGAPVDVEAVKTRLAAALAASLDRLARANREVADHHDLLVFEVAEKAAAGADAAVEG